MFVLFCSNLSGLRGVRPSLFLFDLSVSFLLSRVPRITKFSGGGGSGVGPPRWTIEKQKRNKQKTTKHVVGSCSSAKVNNDKTVQELLIVTQKQDC